MRTTQMLAAVGLACASGAAAIAQPTIITLGDGVTMYGVHDNGQSAFGQAGSVPTIFTFGGNTVGTTPLPTASGYTAASDDLAFITGVVPNTGGLGGLSTTATLSARWSAATNLWSNLGLLTPNPALGVTGSGVSSSSIHSPRDISATGAFIAGQANIAPNNSFRFRPFVWSAAANAGAGESIVLPTSFDAANNRFRDGRALAVSADGTVVVGGEEPNTSNGRPVVWRWNSGTSSYDVSFLPNGTNNGNPITGTVDNFHINAAGTIILGRSAEFNVELNQVESYLTRWTWNAGTQTWGRDLFYNLSNVPVTISSWWNSSCPIPPDFTPLAMTDDGQTIVGILRYSTCGSFVRSSFIYTNGQMHDLYDYLATLGTDMTSFAPPSPGTPPRIGLAVDLSADGRYLVGYGTLVQGSGGPGYIVDFQGQQGCVPPFLTAQPPTSVLMSRCGTITLNAGAGGTAGLTFQWYKDGQPLVDTPSGSTPFISGTTTNRLFISNLTLDQVGTYFCQIVGQCGTPVQTQATVVSLDPAWPTPTNDTCAGAISVGTGVNVLSPAAGLCGAWIDDGEAACSFPNRFDLWYVWTPTFTGDARIETCGANYDTDLTLFDSCGGSILACNDNYNAGPASGCTSSRSRIARHPVQQGVPIYIRAALGTNGTASTSSTLNLSITQAPPIVANDTCENATPIGVGAHAFDLSEATTNLEFPTCAPSAGSIRDVWFLLSPECDGIYRIETCGSGITNPMLTVYDACNGVEIACNNDVGSGQTGCTSQQARISNLVVRASRPVLVRVGIAGATLPTAMNGTLTVVRTGCNPDLNDDGNVDQDDIFYLTQVVAGNDNPTGANPDFNCDGNVDQDDIAALQQVVAGANCP